MVAWSPATTTAPTVSEQRPEAAGLRSALPLVAARERALRVRGVERRRKGASSGGGPRPSQHGSASRLGAETGGNYGALPPATAGVRRISLEGVERQRRGARSGRGEGRGAAVARAEEHRRRGGLRRPRKSAAWGHGEETLLVVLRRISIGELERECGGEPAVCGGEDGGGNQLLVR